MSEVYLSDNYGNRVPPGVVSADPVLASGQTLTDATIGADAEATVVAGASYAVTAVGIAATIGMKLGLADVFASAANVIWVATLYETIVIKIPAGYTVLHYEGIADAASVMLRRLK